MAPHVGGMRGCARAALRRRTSAIEGARGPSSARGRPRLSLPARSSAPRRLSDLRLSYCGTSDVGQIFRSISLNRSTIRLNRAKNLPRPHDPWARTHKLDRLLGNLLVCWHWGAMRLLQKICDLIIFTRKPQVWYVSAMLPPVLSSAYPTYRKILEVWIWTSKAV